MHMLLLLSYSLPSYAESIEAQPVHTSVPLDHAELVELLFARRCAATDVPLVRAQDLVEAFI